MYKTLFATLFYGAVQYHTITLLSMSLFIDRESFAGCSFEMNLE